MNIYMAGKIAAEDWRYEIVRRYCVAADERDGWSDTWRESQFEFWGDKHIYVGPFCSGGKRHDYVDDTHGDQDVFYDPGHHSGFHPNPERRKNIIDKCMDAIRSCDCVFAWLDDPTAYGTLWEMGYAVGLGKKVKVGGAYDHPDLWFPMGGCGGCVPDNSPREAFERFFGPPTVATRSESPIEEQMLVALRAVLPPTVALKQQEAICGGRYRADFVVMAPSRKVVVECDGHDFHEKTKEQAARDKKRDRDMQLEGWGVLRFTGAEIFRNAPACAMEILRFLGLQPEGKEMRDL